MKLILESSKEYSCYTVIKKNPETIDLLAYFLIDDVGGSTELFLPYFESNKDEVGAMNYSQFTKENGIVTITPEWLDEEECIDKGMRFDIKTPVLIKLLELWKDICIEHPRYVTITIENDIPKIVGSDTPPEELIENLG